MADVNNLTITGRLTANAEGKDFSGKTVFKGSLAVSKFNKKEGKEEADFFNFTVWANSSKQAEFYQSVLVKGASVLLIGELKQDKWQDKEGNNRSAVSINAFNVTPMGGKKGGNGANNSLPDELGDDFPM